MPTKSAKKIAYQGIPGAYSEQAATEFGEDALYPYPCKSFAEVFDRVEKRQCQLGIIPLENSVAGSILENYDLLMRRSLWVHGEYKLRVRHNLIALPEARLKDIRSIHSHPQALMQCRGFIETLDEVEAVPEYDTAGSTELIQARGDLSQGAIASQRAAEVRGLKIVKRGIENNPHNFTRFVIIGKKPRTPPAEANKISIVYSLKNIPGALHRSLSVFALRDVDLSRIESRPIEGSPWKYRFYLDFKGHLQDEKIKRCLDHLQELTSEFRVLGNFPACRTTKI